MNPEDAIELVDKAIAPEHLSDIQEKVFRLAWEGMRYPEIAAREDYDAEHIKRVGADLWRKLSKAVGIKVSKSNFRGVLQRYAHNSSTLTSVHPTQSIETHPAENCLVQSNFLDLKEFANVSTFYGRVEELLLLSTWILEDRCRLVAVLGMGGVGKTTLCAKLTKLVQGQFEYVIWRSLRNAPPLSDILASLIKLLSHEQDFDRTEPIDRNISKLILYLQSSRCLLVLDNFETIFKEGDRSGSYCSGFEEYSVLLSRIAEEQHQSCLLLTSREKPEEFAMYEERATYVRSHLLSGLRSDDGLEILNEKKLFGSTEIKRSLVEQYRGNPLALKIVSTSIQELFAGRVDEFLEQGTAVFNGIWVLLERQFNRLSDLEKQIMFWLAINREPTSTSELHKDIVPTVPKRKLLEALESLIRRSLIERTFEGFTQQPVIMEYLTNILIERFSNEIIKDPEFNPSFSFSSLNCYTLIKATAKDYIRESQIRLILKPVTENLLTDFGNLFKAREHLQRILSFCRENSDLYQGYYGGNLLNLISYLEIDLTGFDFSDLTIREAYLQGISLENVNFSQCTFHHSIFSQAFAAVLATVFSPAGELLATGNANGEIHLWRISDGQRLLTCRGHTNWVRRIAFSPDGEILASGSEDRTIRIWNLRNGECLKTIQGDGFSLRTVAFSPDGRYLASGSDDGVIRFWDPIGGNCLKQIQGHASWVLSVVFSLDGKLLASSSADETIRIWEHETGKCLQVLRGHRGWVVPVSLSSDGKRLLSGGFDCTARIWNIEDGSCLHILQGHTAWVWAATFSPNGRLVASAGVDGTIRIWDSSTGYCLHVLRSHIDQVWSVAFHSDNNRLVSGGEDQTIRFWNVQDGKCIRVIQGYINWIKSVTFSQEGQLIVSGGMDGLVRIWDARTHKCLRLLKGHKEGITSVAINLRNRFIVSGSQDRTVKIWSLASQVSCFTLQGHKQAVCSVVFSPNGCILASGSFDRTIRIWDVNDWSCLHILEGHTDRIGAVAFNPDSKLLASASEDQTVKLWDAINGTCIHTLQGHMNRVLTVAFSWDGNILASGDMDNKIKLWDARTGTLLETLEGHDGWVLALAWNPNCLQLASSSCDRTVKIWDIPNSKNSHTFEGHTNWVWSVAFSPDGQTLASSSEDETIKIWDVSSQANLATLRAKKLYEGMNLANTKGLMEAQKVSLRELGAK